MTEDRDRQLRRGRDYPLWPYMKWGHALRHANTLLHDYKLWRGSLGEETRAEYSDDRRVVTFYAALTTSPPTHEWSLAFGDAIHNYRSALDALAWSMANLDDNRPEAQFEKRIYFPMKRTREAFEKEARTNLSSVPGFILERMARVQPYHAKPGEAVDDGIALVLHDLDIADKHKATIETQAVAANMTSYSMTIRTLNSGEAFNLADTSTEWLAPDRGVRDGDPIVRCTFSSPIEEAVIEELPLRLMLRHGAKDYEIFELLQMIDTQVGQTFRVIETGKFTSETQPTGR